MPWGAAAAAAVVAGSYIQGQQAKSAAEKAAQQQREAGQQAADMQKFRPVGITTGFGTSEFTQGPYVTVLRSVDSCFAKSPRNSWNSVLRTISSRLIPR